MQTPESSLEALAIRVAKLEAQNRRLKKMGIASLVAAAAIIAMGQTPTKKVIEANEFVLQDASGKVRARLSMEFTDRPTLSFYNDKSTITASLAGGDNPFLTMQRVGNTGQVELAAGKDFVGLGIYEKEIRAGLSVQKGVAALDVYDEKGRPQMSLAGPTTVAGSTTGPGLTIRDNDSNAFLSMGISPSGGSDFSMYDSKLNQRVSLVVADGKPTLELNDKEGFSATFGATDLIVPKTGRTESTSAASIVLFGKDKKVLWSAP
jgi:hypothetical protein